MIISYYGQDSTAFNSTPALIKLNSFSVEYHQIHSS